MKRKIPKHNLDKGDPKFDLKNITGSQIKFRDMKINLCEIEN